MEKEKFIAYFELCQHYIKVVDGLINADPMSDVVSISIYQKSLVFAAQCLMDYSHALHDSIKSACVEYNLDNSYKVEK